MRQRLRTRSSRVSFLGRIVLVAFLLVALWYGLMTILLALGVPRGPIETVRSIVSVSFWAPKATWGAARVNTRAEAARIRIVVG